MTDGRGLVVLADDLSGAAEAAAATGLPARVVLAAPGVADLPPAGHCLAVDLDLRSRTPEQARAGLAAALRDAAPSPTAVKIDSLLRGPLASYVAAVLDAGHRPVVVPALPAAGRRTRGGRVVLPHAGTAAGHGALEGAPGSVTDALGPDGPPVRTVPLAVVRGGRLADALRGEGGETGEVVVPDVETAEDLAVVAAAVAADPAAVLLGSGAAVAALAGTLGAEPRPTGEAPVEGPLLVVVGSAEEVARDQAGLLCDDGAALVAVDAHALPDPPDLAADLAARLRGGRTVVLTVAEAPLAAERSAPILAALTAAVVRVEAALPDLRLALTGGATARAVLDALGVASAQVVAEVHPGAVHLLTDAGHHVVTRPGSHGDGRSLATIAAHLGHRPTPTPTPTGEVTP